MAKEQLSDALSARMEYEKANHAFFDRSFPDNMAIRRFGGDKAAPVWRPKFAKDIDRILYSPYYNRYTDYPQDSLKYKDKNLFYSISITYVYLIKHKFNFLRPCYLSLGFQVN